MDKLPLHVHASINDHVHQLHIIEQRDKFAKVLRMIRLAGVSQNEDVPDLLDITTGELFVEAPGWSQRVSEALGNVKSVPYQDIFG